MKRWIVLIALLLLSAVAVAGAAGKDSVYVGKILEISPGRIALETASGAVYIGFYGEPAVLERAAGFRVGDEVRAVFGTGTPAGASAAINKLVAIRRCAKNDRECAADASAERARSAADERARAERGRPYDLCRRRMDEALLNDPRYVPEDAVGIVSADADAKRLNAFVGARRACADEILGGHRSAVFDACEAQGCGERVGGGCAHLAGYAVSDATIRKAVQVCEAK